MTKTKTDIKDINMLNDAMFKALFRSIEAREMVVAFLNEITGIDKDILRNAEYQGGELPKKKMHEKGKASDVIIKIENNNKLILEMNQYYNDYIFEKNTSYAFSILSESIPIRAKMYPYVILISFDNFNEFHTKEPILHFMLRDEYGHIETDIYQSIHFILENIVNSKYNVSSETKKMVKLLKSTQISKMEEEFEGDDNYMAAIRKVEDLSTDPNFVGYYDIEEARQQDLENMELTGYRKGKEAGIEQNRIEIAKSMLKDDISLEMISKYTGLPLDQIKKIEK